MTIQIVCREIHNIPNTLNNYKDSIAKNYSKFEKDSGMSNIQQ